MDSPVSRGGLATAAPDSGQPRSGPGPGSRARATTVWLLQNKGAGDNAQVLALGEALAAGRDWQVVVKPVGLRIRDAAKRIFSPIPSLDSFAADGMSPPWPDVVVACGSNSCAIAQWIRRLSARRPGGKRAVHVQLGRLGALPARIDLIVETAQYGVTPTPNMITLTLPIVRPDSERREAAIRAWQPRLAELPRPWLGVLVGGPASPIRFGAEEGRRLAARILALQASLGGSVLIGHGPRTPAKVKAILADELASGIPGRHRVFDWPPEEPNPYGALLGLSDRFLASCDSASMMADVCVTGKPVELFMLPIPERRIWFSTRGLGISVDSRRRRRQRAGKAPDWLDRWRDFLVRNRIMVPFRDMRDFLHMLSGAGVVGILGAAETGHGRDVQRREIESVRGRIDALLRDASRIG